jgi:hypothetical protein
MKIIIAIALAFVFGSANALVPESGWYFNPAESGRGFNIEIQGNTLFMAGFVYDAAGNPIWFVSSGPMSSDRTYSGAAYQTANGQPLGGLYRTPTAVPFGNAAIVFPTTVDADITVNGFNFTVTREIFGFDSTHSRYAGAWGIRHTNSVLSNPCSNKEAIGVEYGPELVVVDSNGNFFTLDSDFPTLLQMTGTITTSGSITMTLYGDSLRPPGNGTCPVGSASGTLTDGDHGSGSFSEGGSSGTFTLTRIR